DRQRDVLLLGRLVATGEKQQESRSSLRVVDSIPRTDIDLQLRNAIGQVSVLPRVTVYQTVNPDQDSGSSRAILQPVNPIAILISLLDPHAARVAQKLRPYQPERRGRSKPLLWAWKLGRCVYSSTSHPAAKPGARPCV